jgi:glycosidase
MKVNQKLVVSTCMLLASFASGFGQQNCATVAASAPCVDKVDPPDWWINLPSPMLLLHGVNLGGGKVSISAKGVTVERTQSSANGHYLFIWLKTDHAVAQQLSLRVATAAGTTTAPFRLASREVRKDAYQGFSSRDVMYLIMPDRFAHGGSSIAIDPAERDFPGGWHGGDLKGIEQHLDYLKQLGVTTIWTTPVLQNSSGLPMPETPAPAAASASPGPAAAPAPANAPAVARSTPSPAEWPPQSAAEVAASRPQRPRPAGAARRPAGSYHGYGVTDMYGVDPHFGTLADYQQLAKAVHARGMKLVLDLVPNHVGARHPWVVDSPTPTWFHGTLAEHDRYKTEFYPLPDPHASKAEGKDVVVGWFGTLADMNQEDPLVSKYEIQNAIWWIESAGLDGLRLDTFPYVSRTFWHDYHAALHGIYPSLTTVGEVFNGDPTITSYFAGGATHDGVDTGLDTPFDFPVYMMLRKILVENQPMYQLEDVLRQDRLYPHPERLVTFFGNHDTGRFLSEPGATVADLKMAFALIATLRGMPEVYSGDEIAMLGGRDPDNRRDFPGGFAGDAQNAFTAAGRSGNAADVFNWSSSLFHLRADHAVLQTGLQQDLFRDKTVFGFVRAADIAHGCTAGGPERFLIIANHSHDARTIEIPAVDTPLEGCTHLEPLLGSLPATNSGHGTVTVQLAPDGTMIYAVR